jgi:hypothetical protein
MFKPVLLQFIKPSLTALAVAAAVSAGAAPVPSQGDWTTTLRSRDINGDGTVDAWYDSVENLTWLNAAPVLTYEDGQAYLGSLDVYGISGWTWGSGISTLYFQRLGNEPFPGGALGAGWTNTGPFGSFVENGGIGTGSGWYWLGLGRNPDPFGPSGYTARVFAADGTGVNLCEQPTSSRYGVWAVRPGDVPNILAAPIPEPETWALSLVGLVLLCAVSRRTRGYTDRCGDSQGFTAAGEMLFKEGTK